MWVTAPAGGVEAGFEDRILPVAAARAVSSVRGPGTRIDTAELAAGEMIICEYAHNDRYADSPHAGRQGQGR
jgi:hypothetical protein